jgi:hypothetical protein
VLESHLLAWDYPWSVAKVLTETLGWGVGGGVKLEIKEGGGITDSPSIGKEGGKGNEKD